MNYNNFIQALVKNKTIELSTSNDKRIVHTLVSTNPTKEEAIFRCNKAINSDTIRIDAIYDQSTITTDAEITKKMDSGFLIKVKFNVESFKELKEITTDHATKETHACLLFTSPYSNQQQVKLSNSLKLISETSRYIFAESFSDKVAEKISNACENKTLTIHESEPREIAIAKVKQLSKNIIKLEKKNDN